MRGTDSAQGNERAQQEGENSASPETRNSKISEQPWKDPWKVPAAARLLRPPKAAQKGSGGRDWGSWACSRRGLL